MTGYRNVNEGVIAASGGRHVDLVAVSKFHPYEAVMDAYADGARIFGENRVQELREKFPPKGERPEGMKLYLIGQLQRNKVKKAVEWVDRIESVDSIPLIDKIESECASLGSTMDVLLEFNSSGEEQKSGFRTGEELLLAADHIVSSCSHIVLKGLMTVGPLGGDEAMIREAFTSAKELFDALRTAVPTATVLSMGMSGDWPIALSCGSDEVRIGTAIFGERNYG